MNIVNKIIITNSLSYYKIETFLNNRMLTIHQIKLKQNKNNNLTLLISKVSEAVNPNILNNEIGEGDNIDNYLKKQKGVRFVINGGFSHYRKNFYKWGNQNFNVGDPVGIVKIREHLFKDYIDLENYGFLVQNTKMICGKY